MSSKKRIFVTMIEGSITQLTGEQIFIGSLCKADLKDLKLLWNTLDTYISVNLPRREKQK